MSNSREQVIKAINTCINKANGLYNSKVRIHNITFDKRMTTVAGRAYYHEKDIYTIKISEAFTETDLNYILNEIVPHEVAHIVCFWMCDHRRRLCDYGHGEHWKKVAMALGASGESKINPPQDSKPKRTYYRYKTTNGDIADLGFHQHYQVQNKFKALAHKNGGRIVSSGFQEKIKK